jgi:hypothetical protein
VPTIESETHVSAPRPVVFGLLNSPTECVRAGPSQSFRNVTPLDGGGHQYEYTFRMAGVPLTGTVRTTTHDPPTRLTNRYEGDIDAEISFLLRDDSEDGCLFRAEATYDLPGRVLEAIADPVVRRYNQRELDNFVENVRSFVEAGYDAEAPPQPFQTGEVAWTAEPALDWDVA